MQKFLQEADNLSKVLFDFESADLSLDYKVASDIAPEKKSQLEAKLLQKINLISDTNTKKHFLQLLRLLKLH
jgi:hypothetical protein